MLLVHGTRDPRGRSAAGALVREVRRARPSAAFRLAFLDVQPPTADRAGRLGDVVVPLLLSAGTHALVDVPALAVHGLRPTPYVGPDARLADLAVRRVEEAGGTEGHTVLLVAAGSRDPAARVDQLRAAELVGERLGAAVEVATVASGTVPARVRELRAQHGRPVAVVTWLLFPGLFADVVRNCGAGVVSSPLGVAREVVEVVLDRFDEAG